MTSEKSADVIVIGAGIAGLTCAALLARSGHDVLLLEAHDKVGGCAGYFDVPSKWGNFRFPVGATVALGLEDGGLHREIFEKLGVECPATPIDRLRVFLPDSTIDVCRSPEEWRRQRQSLPGNRSGQELFWQLQQIIADAGWFALSRKPRLPMQSWNDMQANLALIHPKIAPMLLGMPLSVSELMKWLRIDRDQAFSALVNLQLLITTQSLSHAAPLTNGMVGLDLWRHGAFHPQGGMGSIGLKLLEGFEKEGGRLRMNCKIAKMERGSGGWKLLSSEGEEFYVPNVVANLPIANVERLINFRPLQPRAKQVSQISRRVGRSWGALNLYIAVREEMVPAGLPLHSQVLTRYHRTPPFLKPGACDDAFLSFSDSGDLASAPNGWRALNVSTHVRLEDWQNLDPNEYRLRKREWREKLLTLARIAIPDLDAGRGFVICGTPRTWEGFTGRFQGGVGGAPLSRRNSNFNALPSRIGLPNFHVVGDTTFPGQGTVACALSGWNAWNEIKKSTE